MILAPADEPGGFSTTHSPSSPRVKDALTSDAGMPYLLELGSEELLLSLLPLLLADELRKKFSALATKLLADLPSLKSGPRHGKQAQITPMQGSMAVQMNMPYVSSIIEIVSDLDT